MVGEEKHGGGATTRNVGEETCAMKEEVFEF